MNPILSERFALRTLTVADVSERYLGWLAEADARKFISTAAQTRSLDDLRDYVSAREGRDDVLFLGIFDRDTGQHIGNLKYEPLNRAVGYAVMGILIGEPAYRGKGVATEVIAASGAWLKDHCGIRQLVLGVSEENVAGVRAYEKAGFRVAETAHVGKSVPGMLTMVRDL